jgi:cytochrome P450/NADPH-dependent glutamate synthase beta subunit-like oxidoreductase/flavodoxin
MTSRPAPVADWVTIPELYRDPFPIYERLRAEGGVHWVPAVGRYLITSYEAVHGTELDQEIFSANERGSLQIRAMGHSMLRRDDPEHAIERKAWQPALRPGAVKNVWNRVFAENANRYLDELVEKGPGADLVWDFAAPYAAENLREIIGLHNATQQDLQRWSQTMIDATGNYADDPDVWAEGERSFNEVDAALDEMLAWHGANLDDNPSLIAHLLRIDEYKMPLDRIRANLKMTIGGGVNEPRDALGVAAWALLDNPEPRAAVEQDPSLWGATFDEAIRWVAPIGMYSRQVTRDTVLAGVELPADARLGICILSANRDETVWDDAERFNIHREVKPHLAFGKGVHACLGTWVAKAEVAEIGLPALFSRLRGMRLIDDNPPATAGWVFRGMTKLPIAWESTRDAHDADAPSETEARIAIVGSGPAGCFTGQALRRALPKSRIDVLDESATPFGLVRYGVAADHQGTKSVAQQFERFFDEPGVEFHGNVRVGAQGDVTLEQLRESYDAVVLATGLHRDVPFPVGGGTRPGIFGAGQITRLLNGHPDETDVPELGETVAVVGHGNVAMDLARLLTRRDLTGTDLDDATVERLAGRVRTVHLVGRSAPERAKFDPVMVRELAGMPGLEHVVHGVDFEAFPEGKDARLDAVRELASAGAAASQGAAPHARIEWWFEATPIEATGEGDAGRVSALRLRHADGREAALEVDSIVTAIGFTGDESALAVPGRHPDGRVEPGLYVAGWLRRGPRGAIPDQRTDAKLLARMIAGDLVEAARGADARGALAESGVVAAAAAPAAESMPEGGGCPFGHGAPAEAAPKGAETGPVRRDPASRPELRLPADAIDIAGWRRIDHVERQRTAAGRTRRKLRSRAEQISTATDATVVVPPRAAAAGGSVRITTPVTVAFATESGNSELLAEELVRSLQARGDARLLDLSTARAGDLDVDRFHVIICSTYGDGELPTGVRSLHAELAEAGVDLTGLRYAMFGLGDRSYAKTYSRGSELLDEALAGCGAVRDGEYGRHDAGGPIDASDAGIEWLEGVVAEALVVEAVEADAPRAFVTA